MVNNWTKKVYDRKMSKQITIVGMYWELLPITYLGENQQEVLAKVQSIGKRGGPQD